MAKGSSHGDLIFALVAGVVALYWLSTDSGKKFAAGVKTTINNGIAWAKGLKLTK